MIPYRLPAFLWPNVCDDLHRLGRDFDGGYLVSQRDVLGSDFLLSCGIFDDWSFERDFLKSREESTPLVAFDPTVGAGFFWGRVRSSLPRLAKPQMLYRDLKTLVDYYRFFSGPQRRHIKSLVGAPHFQNSVSIADFIDSEFSGLNGFCKIDVEGSEYRLFDELVEVKEKITGLAIELHDIDLHLDRIERFLTDMDMTVIHCHPNNYGGLTTEGLPLVIELTLSSASDATTTVSHLPHDSDMNNDRNGPVYFSTFDR